MADVVGDEAAEIEAPVATERPAADVPPLTQLHRTYMMFEHDEGVVLIDQHSAHERVLYEQFLRTLEGGEQPAQRLLFPMTLHLGPAEADAFERASERRSSASGSRSKGSADTRCSCAPCRCRTRGSTPSVASGRRWRR